MFDDGFWVETADTTGQMPIADCVEVFYSGRFALASDW